MKTHSNHFILSSFVLLFMFFVTITPLHAKEGENDEFERIVRLSQKKASVYQFLEEISNQTGYSFIYDSELIQNNQVRKIRKGEYSLVDAIRLITGKEDVIIRFESKYIVLMLPGKTQKEKNVILKKESEAEDVYLVLQGRILDDVTRENLSYVSISVNNTTIGTISNQNGEFRLLLPDSLSHAIVRFSHVGYETHEIGASLFSGIFFDCFLKPKLIPIQEVVVRLVDPLKLLQEVIDNKKINYPEESMYLTTFYREGINYKNRNIDLTEAVLQVYKSPYSKDSRGDQVKLIKKRHIVNKEVTDTIFPKMKSGIHACLMLDVMKEIPDFLDIGEKSYYEYFHSDISVLDNKIVNIISFEQKNTIKEPLFQGQLYIDPENATLIEAHFEINPEFIKKATPIFLAKKGSDLNIALQQVKYIVSYKYADDGFYYINHIRGDILFKIKKKRRLFTNPLHFWFESVTCKIDKENVKGFSRKERLSTNKIFAETRHQYDKYFWEHFNIILPEEKLQDFILDELNEVIINELD